MMYYKYIGVSREAEVNVVVVTLTTITIIQSVERFQITVMTMAI